MLFSRYSAIMNERIPKVRGQLPANGRQARNYGQSGSFSNDRLGSQTEGLKYKNSYNIVVYV